MHGHSPVHELAEAKVAATVLFVFAVVVTPREAFWAFGLDAAIVIAVALVAAVPLGRLARRLVIELPFLAFALFLPFIGQGERVQVGFLSLSVAGLWGAWNILIKGTLGVAPRRCSEPPRPCRNCCEGSSASTCPGPSWPSRAS